MHLFLNHSYEINQLCVIMTNDTHTVPYGWLIRIPGCVWVAYTYPWLCMGGSYVSLFYERKMSVQLDSRLIPEENGPSLIEVRSLEFLHLVVMFP